MKNLPKKLKNKMLCLKQIKKLKSQHYKIKNSLSYLKKKLQKEPKKEHLKKQKKWKFNKNKKPKNCNLLKRMPLYKEKKMQRKPQKKQL